MKTISVLLILLFAMSSQAQTIKKMQTEALEKEANAISQHNFLWAIDCLEAKSAEVCVGDFRRKPGDMERLIQMATDMITLVVDHNTSFGLTEDDKQYLRQLVDEDTLQTLSELTESTYNSKSSRQKAYDSSVGTHHDDAVVDTGGY